MNNIKTKKILMWALIIVVILIVFLAKLILAINTVATGFRVIAGGAIMKIDAWGVCRNVENNLAHDIFVPTKTSLEWSEFRIHYPAGVVLRVCAVAECKFFRDCWALYPWCDPYSMDCENGYCCTMGSTTPQGCPLRRCIMQQ